MARSSTAVDHLAELMLLTMHADPSAASLARCRQVEQPRHAPYPRRSFTSHPRSLVFDTDTLSADQHRPDSASRELDFLARIGNDAQPGCGQERAVRRLASRHRGRSRRRLGVRDVRQGKPVPLVSIRAQLTALLSQVYKFDDGTGEEVTAYISFGGLLMALTGDYRHISKVTVGEYIYLLVRR